MTTTQRNGNFVIIFRNSYTGQMDQTAKLNFNLFFGFSVGDYICPIKISEYFAFEKDSCSVETMYVRLFAPNFSPFKNETNWTVCQLEKE